MPRRIKIVGGPTSHGVKILDAETGEDLCEKYFISSINISISPADLVRANLEFSDIEVELESESEFPDDKEEEEDKGNGTSSD